MLVNLLHIESNLAMKWSSINLEWRTRVGVTYNTVSISASDVIFNLSGGKFVMLVVHTL